MQANISHAHNWYLSNPCTDFVEQTNALNGLQYDKQRSSLSNYSLAQQYKDLLQECPSLNPLNKMTENEANMQKRKNNRGTFQHLKEHSIHYQNAKSALIDTFEEMAIGNWLHTGQVHNFFM